MHAEITVSTNNPSLLNIIGAYPSIDGMAPINSAKVVMPNAMPFFSSNIFDTTVHVIGIVMLNMSIASTPQIALLNDSVMAISFINNKTKV